MLMGHKAPFYARNKKYIDENVKEPTDYIVYDHDRIDIDLLRSGMRPDGLLECLAPYSVFISKRQRIRLDCKAKNFKNLMLKE